MNLKHIQGKLIYALLATLSLLSGCAPAPDQGPQGPMAPVSFAKDGLPLDLSYQLRQGFDSVSVFSVNDHNLYYHRHWAEFIPHNVVSRAGPVRELAYNPDQRVGQSQAASPLGSLTLDDLLADPNSRIEGWVVLHKGEIVYEQYPGMRDTDNHIWMSSSKTVISLLTGLLEAEGKIDVDQPIETYLPEFKGSAWEGISIIDIMDMASGLDIAETYENVIGDRTHWFSKWARLTLGDHEGLGSLTSKEALLGMEKGNHAPGYIFDYSSANSHLLGLLIERVAGRRLADLFSERVWHQIGAEGDALLGVDDDGYPSMFGFISSRLRDKARYGLLYTPSWNKVSETKIIPDTLVATIQNECRPKLYARAKEAAGEYWGFSHDPDALCNSRQWDAVYNDGDLYKVGKGGQGLYVSPARDVVVAFFSTGPFDWQDYARAVAKTLVPDP